MARGEVGSGVGQFEPIRITFSWQNGASKQMSGFYLRRSSIINPTPQAAADHVAANLFSEFASFVAGTVSFIELTAVNIVSGEAGSVNLSTFTGAANGDRLPSYVTAVMAMKGELRRRYGQGRQILPVMMEAYTTNDALNASGTAALNAYVAKLNTTYVQTGATSDWKLVNVHGQLPARPATPSSPARPIIPPSYYDVVSLRLNQPVSFLRSRKQGVGS